MSELAVRETAIPGLYEIDLDLRGDSRGWFKENYQQAKLEALGLPHFDIVQNNVSFNAEVGTTRGIHAEPWQKYISVAYGEAFAAIVDLRAGSGFGRLVTFELTPGNAIFVPRGCGNSFQSVQSNTAYTYLVDAHWSPEGKYLSVHPFDPDLGIPWPIPRGKAILSAKDDANPPLGSITPVEA